VQLFATSPCVFSSGRPRYASPALAMLCVVRMSFILDQSLSSKGAAALATYMYDTGAN
jgi:hypothetical protein